MAAEVSLDNAEQAWRIDFHDEADRARWKISQGNRLGAARVPINMSVKYDRRGPQVFAPRDAA